MHYQRLYGVPFLPRSIKHAIWPEFLFFGSPQCIRISRSLGKQCIWMWYISSSKNWVRLSLKELSVPRMIRLWKWSESNVGIITEDTILQSDVN